MPATERQAEWYKAHSKVISVKLTDKADADILAKLIQQESMQGYIKRLIREDIAKDGWRDWVANGRHE